MLYPKKVKHRKWHKMRRAMDGVSPVDSRGLDLSFGSYGLKAMSAARVTSNQIESARKVISRYAGKSGKVWIRIFPDMPVTAKAAEVPMGNGKGDLQGYCSEVKAGRMIFEIDGVADAEAKEALRKAGTKLPLKSKIISRGM